METLSMFPDFKAVETSETCRKAWAELMAKYESHERVDDKGWFGNNGKNLWEDKE